MTWQWFLVEGLNPEPWQAAEGSIGRKDGKMHIRFHSPEQMRLYQESLKSMFVEQNPHAVDHPGDIQLWLYFWRQLTANEIFEGPNRRTHVADATNLQKATEDALQGILYKNDRDIRHVRSTIVSQSADTVPKILIGIGGWDEQQEEVQDVEVIAASLTKGEPVADDGEFYRDLDVDAVF